MVTLPVRGTTPASRLALLAALALVTSAALGGCTADGPPPSHTLGDIKVTQFVPEPATVQENMACPVSWDDFPSNAHTDYPASPRGSVPAGFVTDKVFMCHAGIANDIQLQELQGDFTPLLDALAVPSDRADGQFACPSVLEHIPVLWLVNAEGGAVDAAWPTTRCRQASGKPETQKAVDALTSGQTTVILSPQQGK